MTTRWLAALMLLLAACSPATVVPAPGPTLPPAAASSVAPRPVAVIAHRGGAALAPENTLAAFRNAMALGADVLEMDAHLSADSAVVIIHDPTLERTTDGAGRVASRTLAQLQALNAAAKFAGGTGNREPVPSFGQVLDLIRDSPLRIEVEVKVPPQGRTAGIEERILAEITERQLLERAQISSFDYGVLADVKRLNPRARTVALMSADVFRRIPLELPERIISEAQSAGAEVIAVNKDYLTSALVQAAHAAGMSTEVWTVDDETDMIKFMRMGVDGIISNRPDLLRRTIGK